MNQKTFKWVLSIFACASLIIGCTSSNQNRASRSPSVATPQQNAYSGRINQPILAGATPYNTNVIIDIGAQSAFLLVNGSVAVQSHVSTAKPGKYTPRGTFYITERVRTGKISTIYDVAMPYWMRLNQSPFGMHAGYCPGYPASAGCIRMPSDMARLFFDKTRSGTAVTIVDSWRGY